MLQLNLLRRDQTYLSQLNNNMSREDFSRCRTEYSLETLTSEIEKQVLKRTQVLISKTQVTDEEREG